MCLCSAPCPEAASPRCQSCRRQLRVRHGVYTPAADPDSSSAAAQLAKDLSSSAECIRRSLAQHRSDAAVAREAYELSRMLFQQDLTKPVVPHRFSHIYLPYPGLRTRAEAGVEDLRTNSIVTQASDNQDEEDLVCVVEDTATESSDEVVVVAERQDKGTQTAVDLESEKPPLLLSLRRRCRSLTPKDFKFCGDVHTMGDPLAVEEKQQPPPAKRFKRQHQHQKADGGASFGQRNTRSGRIAERRSARPHFVKTPSCC